MKNFLAIILFVLIIALLPGSSFATPVSFSFGGALKISDSLPITGFSDLLDFRTGRILNADPVSDPLLIPGTNLLLKNKVEIADLHLSGAFSLDNGGTVDPSDDYTVFDISPSIYYDGFKVQSNLGADYLIADLKALTLRTHGGSGNINANELSINLSNIRLSTEGLALNSEILNSLNGSTNGDILTITMQYTGNLDYAIKNGLTINTTYSGTVSLPTNSGGDDGQGEPVPEPNSLLLFGSGIIGLAVFIVLKKRKSYSI